MGLLIKTSCKLNINIKQPPFSWKLFLHNSYVLKHHMVVVQRFCLTTTTLSQKYRIIMTVTYYFHSAERY